MYKQVEKTKENKSRAVANSVNQDKSNVKQGFGFVDNRPLSPKQRALKDGVNEVNLDTLQRQIVAGIQVYDDNGYPVWKTQGTKWHLTMKDEKRWHITKADRSCSYWFECEAGVVTSVKPKKTEYGGHKEKHKELSEAPDGLCAFITNNITDIIGVTEKVPSDW